MLSIIAFSCSRVNAPEAFGPVPTPAQLEWQKMEMNMFVHFGPNTFTNSEWGNGQESADVFAPSDLNCFQWTETARKAGMKGVILTAKHHDGFCLWPNPASIHSVEYSSWRDGKGDVLAELSDACRKSGLKFGIYISPWDRNHPDYGSEKYNDVFRTTLESALGNYGEVYEQWFDGACGEGPNGKRQVYDWNLYHKTVYSKQPDAVIFSDVGPGCRWVGNEAGFAGETCWSTLDTSGFAPGRSPHLDTLNCGNFLGEAWIPAEVDVSVRPGWFYRESEDSQVKSTDKLLEIYYKSVGRNSLLLLNVPADMRGQICAIDSCRLMEFRAALDEIFTENLVDGAKISVSNERGNSRRFRAENMLDGQYDSYWATDDHVTNASIDIELPETRTFNRIMLQEYIPLGQRVCSFSVEAADSTGEWKNIARGTTIGYKRILLCEETTSRLLRINIEGSLACICLNNIALYNDEIYGKCAEEIKVYINALDPSEYSLDYSGVNLEPLTISLDECQEFDGFFYEPEAAGKGGCILSYKLEYSDDKQNWATVYEDRMFDNIVNNPICQYVYFPDTIKAKYLRITPLRTSADGAYSCAACGILRKQDK